MAVLQAKTLALVGGPETWHPSDVAGLGWLVGTLDADNVAKIDPEVITSVGAAAVKMWTPEHWDKLTSQQIEGLGKI